MKVMVSLRYNQSQEDHTLFITHYHGYQTHKLTR